MELKGQANAILSASLLFQSHLYGIERALELCDTDDEVRVSIAPLWN